MIRANIFGLFKRFFFSFSLIIFFSTAFAADPSARVARLSYMSGAVTFKPAGTDQWVYATLNRTLVTDDSLWTDTGARAELQLGGSATQMNSQTSLKILNLNDKTAQLELDQGTINLHISEMGAGQNYEVDTPNLALTPTKIGDYRIDVDPSKQTTTVTVRQGSANVYGKGNSYQITQGNSYSFSGTDLKQFQTVAITSDDFDQWCSQRNARYAKATTQHHVAHTVVGYEDLEDNGRWQSDTTYGDVWYPNDRPADWAPYRYGQWAWIRPYGWTWIGEESWGFAPYHYGRWSYINNNWGWIPGPYNAVPYYAPALVLFFSIGNIGWFPLGPRDVYIPPYAYSRGYFNNVNFSNAALNAGVVRNAFNNPRASRVYANRNNGVTAMSANNFAESKSVAKSAVKLTPNELKDAKLSPTANIKPSLTSITGGAKTANTKPTASPKVIAKTQPPASTGRKTGTTATNVQTLRKPVKPTTIPTTTKQVGSQNKTGTAPKSQTVPHPPSASSNVQHKPTTMMPVNHGKPATIPNNVPAIRAPESHAAPATHKAPESHAAPVTHKAPKSHAAPVTQKAPKSHAAPVTHRAPESHAAPAARHESRK